MLKERGLSDHEIHSILDDNPKRFFAGETLPLVNAGLRSMEADYIVVGAGSAGCVVAARLSETGARVLLLEAGPKDSLPWIHIPAGVLKLLYHPVVNWNYTAEGSEGSGGRQIHWPRGKTLGGSSSINGMLYVRGNPADFDGWAQMGCRGWSFDDVLPYFRKSEDYKQGCRCRISRQRWSVEGRGLPDHSAADPQVHRGRAASGL